MAKKVTLTEGTAGRSNARTFYQLDVTTDLSQENKPEIVFRRHEYVHYEGVVDRKLVQDGLIRNFPFLFKANGEPWELGNLYLINRFDEEAEYRRPTVSTYDSVAGHLADFRRFIDAEQAKQKESNPNICGKDLFDEFFMPRHKARRVTYRYRSDLIRRIKSKDGNEKIGLKTAQNRINHVVSFYRFLMEIKGKDVFDNPPFKDTTVAIQTAGDGMGSRTLMRPTTDLRISGKGMSQEGRGGILDEGERLHPLKRGKYNDDGTYVKGEQDYFHEELAAMGNYTFQLIAWVMLFTGVRVQTACTLRIKDLKNTRDKQLFSPQGEHLVKIGAGTDIDVKFSRSQMKHGYMYIEPALLDLLIEYAESPFHWKCMEKSFYGVSDENYVFLSNRGNPYYTSEQEALDREDHKYSGRIDIRDRGNYPVSEGDSIRQWVDALVKRIKRVYPKCRKFRPHDLRATFAVNYVFYGIEAGVPRNQLLDRLKGRLLHDNVGTTLLYLDYEELEEVVNEAHEHHSNRVFEVIHKYVLGNVQEIE